MHLFKFFVDEEGWPIMLYKELAVDLHWLPRNKPHVCLWKANANNRLKILRGIPKPVLVRRVWREELPSPTRNKKKALEKANKVLEKKSFIKTGICGYISFWERGMVKC